MARRGKTLTFEAEEIEELAEMEYRDRRLFALLSLLYPFVDLRNQFHMDHIFSFSRFAPTRLRRSGVSEDKIELYREDANKLGNLQLLEGPINNEKREKLSLDWLNQRFPDLANRQHYCVLHDLGEVPDNIIMFDQFYEARRQRLREKITTLLSS